MSAFSRPTLAGGWAQGVRTETSSRADLSGGWSQSPNELTSVQQDFVASYQVHGYLSGTLPAGNTGVTGATSIVCAAENHKDGATILVAARNYNVLGSPDIRSIASITDTAGNTYARLGAVENIDGVDATEMWGAFDIIGHPANVITIDYGQLASYARPVIAQYFGLTSLHASSAAQSTPPTSLVHASPSVTTTGPALLVALSFNYSGAGDAATESGGSEIRIVDAASQAVVDRLVSGAGAYTTEFTTATANQVVTIVRAFNMAPSSGLPETFLGLAAGVDLNTRAPWIRHSGRIDGFTSDDRITGRNDNTDSIYEYRLGTWSANQRVGIQVTDKPGGGGSGYIGPAVRITSTGSCWAAILPVSGSNLLYLNRYVDGIYASEAYTFAGPPSGQTSTYVELSIEDLGGGNSRLKVYYDGVLKLTQDVSTGPAAGNPGIGAYYGDALYADGFNAVDLTGTTSVTSDLAATYNVIAGVQQDLSASYAVRGVAQQDLGASYAVQGAAQQDLTATYTVISSVTNDLAATYPIQGAVQQDLAASFALLNAPLSDLAATYAILGAVSSDLAPTYAIRGATQADLSQSFALQGSVQSDLAPVYDILTASSVTKDLSSAYDVLNSVQADSAQGYGVLTAAQLDLAATYSLINAVQKDLAAAYTVIQSVLSDYTGSYVLGDTVVSDMPGAYSVLNASQADLGASYLVYQAVFADVQATYSLLAKLEVDLAASYGLTSSLVEDLSASWLMTGSAVASLSASYTIFGDTIIGPPFVFTGDPNARIAFDLGPCAILSNGWMSWKF